MPLILTENKRGFKFESAPREGLDIFHRRTSPEVLKAIGQMLDSAKDWTKTLTRGPFPFDPDDDLRTQSEIRLERREAKLAVGKAIQIMLQLLAIFAPHFIPENKV